jgi:hypothetical protein
MLVNANVIPNMTIVTSNAPVIWLLTSSTANVLTTAQLNIAPLEHSSIMINAHANKTMTTKGVKKNALSTKSLTKKLVNANMLSLSLASKNQLPAHLAHTGAITSVDVNMIKNTNVSSKNAHLDQDSTT